MTIEIQRGKVVEVDRGHGRTRAGQGVLKGMGVIWHHWRKSFQKLDDFSQTAGTFTVEYPEERLPLPEASRNMPILLFDDATGHELCTSCFQCQRICPPQVIHMTQAKNPETGKAVPAVAEFVIEYDACMSCGFCAEVCPFDAIKMDHDYELSTDVHGGLTISKEALNRPASYYAQIAPRMWDEAKANAYKKLQGTMKRRVDLIGIAPQVIERVKALQAEQAAAAPVAAPVANTSDAPVEDKAARLARIRAQNATKQADAASANGDDVSDDKAARLARIRAQNEAKKAAAQSMPSDE